MEEIYYHPGEDRLILAERRMWCWLYTYDYEHYQRYAFEPEAHGYIYIGDI